MLCYIYRCSLKPDTYIYLAEEDNFEKMPEAIFNTLGIVEFSMELEISADTKLAKEDTETVISNLKEHSFHIQLPSEETVEAIMTRIAEEKNKRVSD